MNCDDTMCTTPGMREATFIEMLDNNLLPSFRTIKTSSLEDIEVFRKECEAGAEIVFFRIPRDIAEGGSPSGVACSRFMLEVVPEKVRGRVMLSFDGWSDDSRELFQIEEVVAFCRGFLLAYPGSPDREHTKKVLLTLIDEDSRALEGGKIVDRSWLDAAGSVWLCSTAFPEEVFLRSKEAPSGWLRDYGLSYQIREWLLGNSGPPEGAWKR